MSDWLLVSPRCMDDPALEVSAWIAAATASRAPQAPRLLTEAAAVRGSFEAQVKDSADLAGVAFFGHGKDDRLDGADRDPLLDSDNVALLGGCWVHAFACLSGVKLAHRAVLQGAAIYVGYRRPLNVSFDVPPPAEAEFVDLVSCVTLALLAGERDAAALQKRVSEAADRFVSVTQQLPPDAHPGLFCLELLAQDLVDHLTVIRRS